MLAQEFKSFPGDEKVGVLQGRHYATYPGGDDRNDTRGCFPPMRTRLQIDIKRGSPRFQPRAADCINFSVVTTEGVMIPLPYNFAAADQHASHQRIRVNIPRS